MKVVSFNIRCAWNGDGINSFMHRIGLIYEKVQKEKPDVIGFQEMMDEHLDVLVKIFPEYQFTGSGRYKNYAGEGVYTAFRKDRFTEIEKKVFWLSETPEIPESKFDYQTCMRNCIATCLYHKESGKCFYVYNVHMDHYHLIHKDADPKVDARTKSAKLILERINADIKEKGFPVIFMGDFNSTPDTDAVKLCKQSGLTDVSEDMTFTFHKYGKENYRKIDYIFVTPDLKDKATPAIIWDDVKNGIYLSDHYPIVTEIDL